MQPYWLWQKNTKSHHTKLSCIVKVKGCAHSRLSQDRGWVRHDRLQRAAFFYMESVTSRQLLSNDKRQPRKERLGSVLPAYRARKDLLRAQASQTLWAHLSLSLFYHIPFSLPFLPHPFLSPFSTTSLCFSTTSLSLSVFYHISLFFYHICVCFLPHLSLSLGVFYHISLCFSTTSVSSATSLSLCV